MADCEKALLAGTEASCLKDSLKMARGIAVFSIVNKREVVLVSKALRMMQLVDGNDVHDRYSF